jgi:hypothetical protein
MPDPPNNVQNIPTMVELACVRNWETSAKRSERRILQVVAKT